MESEAVILFFSAIDQPSMRLIDVDRILRREPVDGQSLDTDLLIKGLTLHPLSSKLCRLADGEFLASIIKR